jgi:hypothetical protein
LNDLIKPTLQLLLKGFLSELQLQSQSHVYPLLGSLSLVEIDPHSNDQPEKTKMISFDN